MSLETSSMLFRGLLLYILICTDGISTAAILQQAFEQDSYSPSALLVQNDFQSKEKNSMEPAWKSTISTSNSSKEAGTSDKQISLPRGDEMKTEYQIAPRDNDWAEYENPGTSEWNPEKMDKNSKRGEMLSYFLFGKSKPEPLFRP